MNIRWSILALVSAIVLAALGLSYGMMRELLQATISERESEKVATVATLVESLVGEYAEGTQLAARVLSTSPRLTRRLAAPPKGGDREPPLETILAPLLSEQVIDSLEITDDREIVRYSYQSDTPIGSRADTWGVSEALGGQGSMVSRVMPDGVGVLAIEPLRENGRIVGTLILGRHLHAPFLRDLAAKVKAELALASRTKVLATTSRIAAATLDKAAIEEAFQQKIPVHRTHDDGRVKVVYLPLLVVDDGFVIMVRLDSSAVFLALNDSFRQVLLWTALFLVAAIVAAYLLLNVLLRPLRALRTRAEETAFKATGSTIASAAGDEIGSVVQVLDTLTERLLKQNLDLARSRTQADAASEAKSQFLSRMSHEIRTPLNGVLGMAELLQATALTAEQRRYCEAISASGRSLHELLGDILDLSKIEAQKVAIESIDFDLVQLTNDLRAAFTEQAVGRSNTLSAILDIPAPGRFRGDPTRLRQVLSNLVGNAIKFTQRGHIALEVSPLPAQDGDSHQWLRFSVTDTGIGIAPDKLPELFQPFVQADSSTTRRYGGTGLGLAISRHLVALLGGTLQVASEPGEGTRFWFDLPFAPAQAAAPAPATAGTAVAANVPEAAVLPRGQPVRVLLAEDIPVNQEVIALMLGRSGAQVRCVQNGEEAVQAAREEAFDVILMDCQMPVMDGFEATRRIRSGEAPGRRLPIIALTASAFSDDRERCLAAGMDDYLSKPVQWNTLERTVAQWAGNALARQASGPAPSHESVDAPAAGGHLDQAVIDRLAGAIGAEGVGRIMRTYLRTGPSEMEALAQCAEKRDLPGLGDRMHALKSSSRSLGGARLSDLALAGERLARAGDESALGMLPAIVQAQAEFCNALAAHPLARLGDGEAASPRS